MKVLEGSNLKTYPYQLTNWMKSLEELESFTDTFKQYRQSHRARILHSSLGYAIFTDGKARYQEE